MPLIFSYFHNIIGPDVLYQTDNVKTYSDEEIQQILRLLDTADEGFFTYNLPKLKTANYYFTVSSPWARGRKEMLMISVIIQEQDPDLDYYENKLEEFVQVIKGIPDVFKSCYFRNPQDGEEEEITRLKSLLIAEVDQLADEFSLQRVRTWGMLVPFDQLENERKIEIPQNLFRDFVAITGGKAKNCFFVHRKRADTIKIDMIPVTGDKVLKISIEFTEMNPEILKQLTIILKDLNLPVVFTSGICEDEDHCLYELYVDSAAISSYDEIVTQIMNLKFIQNVQLKRVHLITIGFEG